MNTAANTIDSSPMNTRIGATNARSAGGVHDRQQAQQRDERAGPTTRPASRRGDGRSPSGMGFHDCTAIRRETHLGALAT
jgi:hypothetical protein